MRLNIILYSLFLCLFFAYSEEILYTENERKELLYSCLEENIESCATLIQDGLPSLQECNAKTTCIIIAHIYTIAQQPQNALQYYNKSCKADILQSCFELALSYETLQQYRDSKREYENSCHSGFMPSCYNLAMLYVHGLGVQQDMRKANRLFEEVCLSEDSEACYNLAISYRNGEGLKADRLKAKTFFEKACNMGMQEACKEFKILDAANFSIMPPTIQE